MAPDIQRPWKRRDSNAGVFRSTFANQFLGYLVRPCVEELPLLDRFYQQNMSKGWQVLGLAVDNAASVEQFLKRIPIQFPVALAGMEGVALSKALGNDGGGLPYTLVLGSAGKVLHRKMGRVTTADLTQWITIK